MPDSPDSHPRDADRLIYAGLLGLSAASVIQMVDKSDLNTQQLVAAHAFAVAIPLLAVGLVTDYARRAGTPIPRWRDGLGLAGTLASVCGLGAIFFNFGAGPGCVFAVGCFVGLILVRAL
jgi:hypothetical protein